MDNPGEILRLCRLCLVKDQVNIPIFEEQGDIKQTFLKIRSCLPVKVSRDDKLPKKICGGCSNKLDLFYEFWSSTANSEKTLQSWLGQEEEDDKMQEITKPVEALVKEESEALEDGHAHDQSFDEATKDEAEAPPAKRARRTAAVKAQINISHDSDEDEDVDGAEPITKIEDESDESDGEEKDPSYTEVPGTSADDQAGPSGLGKDGVEAPYGEPSYKSTLICTECGVIYSTKAAVLSHLKIHRTFIRSTDFKHYRFSGPPDRTPILPAGEEERRIVSVKTNGSQRSDPPELTCVLSLPSKPTSKAKLFSPHADGNLYPEIAHMTNLTIAKSSKKARSTPLTLVVTPISANPRKLLKAEKQPLINMPEQIPRTRKFNINEGNHEEEENFNAQAEKCSNGGISTSELEAQLITLAAEAESCAALSEFKGDPVEVSNISLLGLGNLGSKLVREILSERFSVCIEADNVVLVGGKGGDMKSWSGA